MEAEATDLPKLPAPARRALLGAGYARLEQLTEVSESEVMRLHGMGPKAMRVLREALLRLVGSRHAEQATAGWR